MTFGAMGKTASLSLLDSQVTGTASKNILFSQVANGTLGMNDAIAVHAEYWGAADGPTGPASLWLFLDTARGRYSYVGSASLQSIVSPADGTTTYTYSGSFVLNASPSTDGSVPAKIPHDGTFELSLGFWQDNTTLYISALSLSASAEDAP
jgi:hypothetical protein